MEDSREDHWRDVAYEGEDKSKIHALGWYVYTKQKKELINRYFWCLYHIRKGGTLFGLVRRMISSRKMRTTKLLDYVDLVIDYLNKRRIGGFERDYTDL